MKISNNHPLKALNSFGISANAEHFIAVNTEEELLRLLKYNFSPLHILGGGSNILLTGDISGIVVKNDIAGIDAVLSQEDTVIVDAGGGVIWHELVTWCIERGYGGIENLALIPGTAGAAPIQNIGAYGVELQDVFLKLEAIDLSSGEKRVFTKEDCQFKYRESVFKKELKGRYFITKIWLRLSTQPEVNIGYGDIQSTLQTMGVAKPGIKELGEAIIRIRSSKLPNPKVLGNAGSFFKNPEIEIGHFEALRLKYPEIVYYLLPNGKVKIPAGWLIEQSGWKGKRIGNAGSHEKQALVIVNYGDATGQEILGFSAKIQKSIESDFGIQLEPEVNIW